MTEEFNSIFNTIFSSLSNREIAFLILVLAIFVIVLFTNVKGLINLLLTIFKTLKFIIVLFLFNLYIYLIITFITTILDINIVTKDLLFWAIGSNFLLFNAIKVRDGFRIKNLFYKIFGLSVVVEFFVHFDSFSIPIEILILISSLTLTYLKVRKESKGESVTGINLFFSVIFIILLTKSTLGIYNNSSNILIDFSTQVLLLPSLSVILIPILYLIHVYVIYDNIFIMFKTIYLEDKNRAILNVISVGKLSSKSLLCIYRKFSKFDYSFAKAKKKYLKSIMETSD